MTRKSNQTPLDINAAILRIQELGIRRRQFIKARIRVLNAGGALIRRYLGWRGDMDEASTAKINKQAAQIMAAKDLGKLPSELIEAGRYLETEIVIAKEMAAPGEKHQHSIELEMRKLARQFPVWESWAKNVHGFSDLGLAIIIAEAGDIGSYTDKGKLWKRLGLAPINKDGETRAASTWRSKGGLSADDWIDAGYNPSRRASIYAQVGNTIIGGVGLGHRPLVGEDIELNNSLHHYEKVFINRLRYEAARDPDMSRPATKAGKESFSKHCAARAQRYTEKRLLRDLWQAWRMAIDDVSMSTMTETGMRTSSAPNLSANRGSPKGQLICADKVPA